MKKLFCILISAAMLFMLCACGVGKVELPPLPTVTPTPAESAEATPEVQPETPEEAVKLPSPGVIVRITNTKLENYDPQTGETLILSYSYDTPNVSIEGRDECASKINEYTATIEEAYYTGGDFGGGYGIGYMDMLTMAEDNYNYIVSSGMESGVFEMSADRSVSVMRGDGNVLALRYDDYLYLGEGQGTYLTRAYCFDTETGERITLSQLGADYAELENRLLDYMVSSVEGSEHLSESIDLTLADAPDMREFLRTTLKDDYWYFDEDGITVFTDLTEVSSGTAGLLFLSVPYSELEGAINEKWLPEDKSGDGMFMLVSQNEMEDGSIEIIDMVKAAGEGECIYAVATGTVYDVTVSTVGFAENFYEKGLHWYCSEMDGSALQVVTMVPDGLPNLRLSWKNADGQFSKLISRSGEDGSYILVDDNIEAVG